MHSIEEHAPLADDGPHSSQMIPLEGRPPRKLFGDLKIGVKLALAFGVLVALVLMTVWLAYQSSTRAIVSNSQTKALRVPALLAATQAKTNLLRIRSSIRAHLIFGDAPSRAACVEAQENFAADLTLLGQLGDVLLVDEMALSFERINRLSEKMFALRNNLLENQPAQRILVKEADFNFNLVLDKIRQIALAQAQRPPSVRTTRQLVVITDVQRSFALMVSALRRFISSGALIFKQEYELNKLENDIAWKLLMAEREGLLPYQRVFLDETVQLREALAPLPQKMFAIVESDRTREDLYLFRTQFAPLSDELLKSLETIVNEQSQMLETQLKTSSQRLRLTQRQTLIGGVVALILGLALAFFFRHRIASPIVRLTAVATQYVGGHLTSKATVESRDEIGMLATVFNEMTAQLRRSIESLEDQARQLFQANTDLTQEIVVRKQAESEIRKLNTELEQRVIARTAELRVAKEQAEAANRAKSGFLARMSHEIRTPLNAVIGLTQVVLKSELTQTQRERLAKVQLAGNNLLAVINDILDFSKVEAGRMDIVNTPFDLDLVMEHLANLFSNRLADKDIELIFDLSTKVPCQLTGDAVRLTQILTNLVENAYKFTDTGEIVIGVDIVEKDSPATLEFRVQDTGCGIPAEVLPILFDPFTQADNSLTRQYEGTGLGLSICQRLSKLMGGDIWVRSTQGKGSTFFFSVKMEVRAFGKARMRPPLEMRGLKTLVVDGSDTARKVLVEMLASFEFNVSAAASGEKAIAELQRAGADAPYQLVLVDWKTPGLDGLETAGRMRVIHPNSSSIPIVTLVTAYGQRLLRRQRSTMDTDTVLLKPVSASQLFNTIIKLFYPTAPLSLHPEVPTRSRLAGCRVILVEDNALNREVGVALLEAAGLEVETAENGKIAVEKVTRSSGRPYGAVLMDIQMPIMDGFEATKRIRAIERDALKSCPVDQQGGGGGLRRIPIIALTAHALDGEREACLAAGMDDYLAKPIDEQKLFRSLDKWMIALQQSGDAGELSRASSEAPNSSVLDVYGALKRLGGRETLYTKTLERFKLECGQWEEIVRRLIADGEHTSAAQTLHKVKGSATTIGASDLARATERLETSVLNKGNDSRLLSDFKLALNRTMAAVEKYQNTKTTPGRQTPSVDSQDGVSDDTADP